MGSRTSATFDHENAEGTVNINGGTVVGKVTGSRAWGSGTTTGTINIKGGTIEGKVVGAFGPNATGTVNISGGTVGDNHLSDTVTGADSDLLISTNYDATGTVNISGGIVNADVIGSNASGNAVGVVKVTGGKVYGSILGSRAFNGDASGNTVTIGNGAELIYNGISGGHSAKGNATGNTIILEGVAINGLFIQGGSVQETGDPVTGNKLILTKSGNTASQARVTNFQTIELSNSLGWSANSTVFSADSFPNNDDGTRAALDISKSKLTSATTKGTMTLLKSNKPNDFNTLSLIYSGGTATLNSSNQKKDVKTGTETTESSPVNGVTLKYKDVHTVSLDAANSYMNVL